MPEIIEVLIISEQIKNFINMKVESISYKHKRHRILEKLPQTRLNHVDSCGTELYITFNGLTLIIHFMLFGVVRYQHDNDTIAAINFTNGCLCFVDRINLLEITEFTGTVKCADVLTMSKSQFYDNLYMKRRSMIGTALLDQNKFRGIGKYIRNELLYYAGIYPYDNVGQLLDSGRLDDVYDVMMDLFHEIRHKGGSAKYGGRYVYKIHGKKKYNAGNGIYFDEDVQKPLLNRTSS